MELLLAGLRFETCLIYLDDTIVYGKTFLEELERLEEVFVRFESAGLKLKPGKCVLFQKSVAYLGHLVSERGIETDPSKVERVCEWPAPENATEELPRTCQLLSTFCSKLCSSGQASSQINRS